MSTRTKLPNNSPLSFRQSTGATPTSSRATSSHGFMLAAGAHSVNLELPTQPMPAKRGDEALQQAIQGYVKKLSDDDKAAFQAAPDIIERLQEMKCNGKSLISSSLTTRVEKVLQCLKIFMGIFIQQCPGISSLVIGGVNCIMGVGTSYLLFI